MRAIDADSLNNYKFGENLMASSYADGWDDAIDAIMKDAPTIEERPKGEWIYEYDDFYRCSICGRAICTEWDELSLEKHFPFCHCGADMR